MTHNGDCFISDTLVPGELLCDKPVDTRYSFRRLVFSAIGILSYNSLLDCETEQGENIV